MQTTTSGCYAALGSPHCGLGEASLIRHALRDSWRAARREGRGRGRDTFGLDGVARGVELLLMGEGPLPGAGAVAFGCTGEIEREIMSSRPLSLRQTPHHFLPSQTFIMLAADENVRFPVDEVRSSRFLDGLT